MVSLAAVGHGVPGVHGHVDDHLFQLTLVDHNRAQIAAMDHRQFDMLTDQAANQIDQLRQHVGEI